MLPWAGRLGQWGFIYVVTREKETPGDMSGYDFRDACEAGDLDKVKGEDIKKYLMKGV